MRIFLQYQNLLSTYPQAQGDEPLIFDVVLYAEVQRGAMAPQKEA